MPVLISAKSSEKAFRCTVMFVGKVLQFVHCLFKATSEARGLIVCVWFFFAGTWHPSAFVKVSAIFFQAYFSETIQNFKNRTATECPFWPCKKVPKSFRLGDFISSENTIFSKIFSLFFPILRNFTTWTISNRLKIGTNWRKRMSFSRSWKFHYLTIIGRWENGD